jgi:NAD(P)-dependent dehydrogenase (short-subunit alcohol dehydrogenase family)
LKEVYLKEFKDKVAVITGAASGIGFGLAERCAQEGMKIVLADVEEEVLQQAETQIRSIGVDTLAVKTDVSKAEEVEALVKKTIERFGAVHLLCNNAGVAGGGTVWDSTLADWRWVLGVNLWGVIHGLHYFVPIMLNQDTECHIVNTASTAGLIASPRMAPYAVSKHGIVAISETLYKQLEERKTKIGVSVLCPGYVRTRLTESDRNRPKELLEDVNGDSGSWDEEMQAFLDKARQLVEGGIPPKHVAEMIFSAVRDNRFYVFPNAGDFKLLMQARMEDILQERNPTTVNIDLK